MILRCPQNARRYWAAGLQTAVGRTGRFLCLVSPMGPSKHRAVTVWWDSAVSASYYKNKPLFSPPLTGHAIQATWLRAKSLTLTSSLRSTSASSLFLSLLFHPPSTLLFPTLLSTHNRQTWRGTRQKAGWVN